MGEGLFPLGTLPTPFDQAAVAAGITRVRTPIYFVATVFPDRASLRAFQPPPPDRATASGRKVFLDEGVVLWYVGLTRADLEGIDDRLSPVWFELTRAFADTTSLPAQRVVPMEGGAAAFCVAGDGTLLTNYHVAHEEIEAHRRTQGSGDPVPCRYLRADAGCGLELLAHPAQDDWKRGHDWAVLRLPGAGLRPLPLAGRAPVVGEPVWSFGFPMRTRRNRAEYPDADGSLRVAAGRVTQVRVDGIFGADLDGFSGNSGGPVVDAGGRVLGMVHNVDPPGEQAGRGIAFQGGMASVGLGPAHQALGAAFRR